MRRGESASGSWNVAVQALPCQMLSTTRSSFAMTRDLHSPISTCAGLRTTRGSCRIESLRWSCRQCATARTPLSTDRPPVMARLLVGPFAERQTAALRGGEPLACREHWRLT